MADNVALQLHVVYELFVNNTEDSIFTEIACINDAIYLLYNFPKMRRAHVPRIRGYAEEVVPQYSDVDFRYHFRLSRQMFEEILGLVGVFLSSEHGGGIDETDPAKQLLVFLCYMSNQESMRELAHYFGIGQSTVHGIIRRVTKVIVENLGNVIQWPDHAAQQRISTQYQLQCAMAGIVGVLDGTHIRLASAPHGNRDYINRKSFPSMQLQVVVDDNLMIRHAYTGWPGCTHDARVLRNSSLCAGADGGDYFHNNTFIIGDSAYPLKPWLITPFRDNGHLNALERRFNRVLSSARQDVERGIGHLKGRFRRLRELTVHAPDDIVVTIISGCILHNLCIIHEDSVEDFIELDDDGHPNQYPNIFVNAPAGIQRRRQLMEGLP